MVAALRRSVALTQGIVLEDFRRLAAVRGGLRGRGGGGGVGVRSIFKLLAPGAGPFGVGAIVVALLLGVVRDHLHGLISAFSAKLYRAAIAAREGVAAA